jgi:hypothetical protein
MGGHGYQRWWYGCLRGRASPPRARPAASGRTRRATGGPSGPRRDRREPEDRAEAARACVDPDHCGYLRGLGSRRPHAHDGRRSRGARVDRVTGYPCQNSTGASTSGLGSAANRSPRRHARKARVCGPFEVLGGDGGNRTHVRDRAQDGVYERIRRSISHPPLATPAGLRRASLRRCPPRGRGSPRGVSLLSESAGPVAGSGGPTSSPSFG